MHIEATVNRDRTYVRHLSRRRSLRVRIAMIYLGTVVALCSVPGLVAEGPAQITSLVPIVVGLLLVLTALVAPRRSVRTLPDRLFGPHTYRLTDQCYAVTTRGMRVEIDWSEYVSATETPRAFLLWRVPRVAADDVPKSVFTGDELVEFRAFLAGRRLLGPAPTAPPADGRPPAVRPAAPGFRPSSGAGGE